MSPKGLEHAERAELLIDKSPLLRNVYEGKEGVHEEYELERRYLPTRLLSERELAKYKKLEIEQTYIFAQDVKGKERTFRLRRTWEESGGKHEGLLLRVAHKAKIADSDARNERQQRFSEFSPEADEFRRLWARREWEPLRKRRYYIPLPLPNGSECEIHYDVHPFWPLEGFVRIEIEFRNAGDERYVRKNGRDGILPDWIGEDVTKDEHYGGKALAKDGMPPGSEELMEKLRKNAVGAR